MAVTTAGASSTDAPAATKPPDSRGGRRSSYRWSRRDKTVLGLMTGVPTAISVLLVWIPALASVALSFTRWDGIGLDSISWVGLRNYREIFTIYPPFFPALWHNVIWLGFFLLIPTPIGLLLATLLDKEIRGSRLYQSAIFLPVGALAGHRRVHLAAHLLDRPGPGQRGHHQVRRGAGGLARQTRTSTCGRC